MDGVHDVGGLDGFGPVRVGDDAPWTEEWERRVFGLGMVLWCDDVVPGNSRPEIEEMAPAAYLGARYYERWLAAIERQLVRGGAVAAGELDEAVRRLQEGHLPRRSDPALRERVLERVDTPRPLPPAPGARFHPGARVRGRRMRERRHTRCPRYLRGVVGTVDWVHGLDALPEQAAYGDEARAEPVYSVRYRSIDLWGPRAERFTVTVDLWESYLERAGDE